VADAVFNIFCCSLWLIFAVAVVVAVADADLLVVPVVFAAAVLICCCCGRRLVVVVGGDYCGSLSRQRSLRCWLSRSFVLPQSLIVAAAVVVLWKYDAKTFFNPSIVSDCQTLFSIWKNDSLCIHLDRCVVHTQTLRGHGKLFLGIVTTGKDC